MKRQSSLEESGELVRLWDINDSRAQRVHRTVGEMIAIDLPAILCRGGCWLHSFIEAVGTEVLPSESEIYNRSDTPTNPSRCHS